MFWYKERIYHDLAAFSHGRIKFYVVFFGIKTETSACVKGADQQPVGRWETQLFCCQRWVLQQIRAIKYNLGTWNYSITLKYLFPVALVYLIIFSNNQNLFSPAYNFRSILWVHMKHAELWIYLFGLKRPRFYFLFFPVRC